MIYFWLLNLLIFLNFQNTKYTFKIAEVYEGPIIIKRDTETEDNKYGFEGVRAFKYKGEYHLFTSKRFGRSRPSKNGFRNFLYSLK